MSRPTGALHDPGASPRGLPIARLASVQRAAASTLPDTVDLRSFAKRRVNQTDQGCVGHAIGQAIRMRSEILGTPIDVADRPIYSLARELENPSLKSLPDNGSFTHLAIDGITKWGVVDRARLPDSTDVTRRVPQDVFEAGAVAKVDGAYFVDSENDQKKYDIMTALAAGEPFVFCMDVDASYEAYKGGVWQGMTGPSKGGHAQTGAGYTPAGLIVVNSWWDPLQPDPDPWGDKGSSIIAWEYVISKAIREISVVTFVPQVAL